MNQPLLKVSNLRVELSSDAARVPVLDGAELDIQRGQTLCVVGESGCGKSILALSIMGLLPAQMNIVRGSILLDGQQLRSMPPSQLRVLYGRRMAMVFQNPSACLNPLLTIGAHLAEALRAVGVTKARVIRQRSLQMLAEVGIEPEPARLLQYPHELSGGLQQRVLIAMAVVAQPDLLIADEPTTALDASVQAQILQLLRQLQQRSGMAMLFITHDLGLVAELADHVAVMYAGQVVEHGTTAQVLGDPQHPYTLALLASSPQLSAYGQRLPTIAGHVPLPGRWPVGCSFQTRCVFADSDCRVSLPPLREVTARGHRLACWRAPLEETCA